MSEHFVDKTKPSLGYYHIETGEEGSRWLWNETAGGVQYQDAGHWFATVADAYRDAADDWESNGNSANRRLSGQLRAAATRTEK
jgi:hypothetical protein